MFLNRSKILPILGFFLFISPLFGENDPRSLLEEMVQANGGKDRFYSFGGVEYEYIVYPFVTEEEEMNVENERDESVERYRFDGEKSWGRYLYRQFRMDPENKGEMIQGFDGSQAWVTMDGKEVMDPEVIKKARLTRKRNYFKLIMMFKWLDPGYVYEDKGERRVEGKTYQLVKAVFKPTENKGGDVYILYVNKETKLVDQYVFVSPQSGIKTPRLMKVRYDELLGVKLPTWRKSAPSDWNGNVKEGVEWVAEICRNVHLTKRIDPTIFEAP